SRASTGSEWPRRGYPAAQRATPSTRSEWPRRRYPAAPRASPSLGPLRELREVGRALLHVCRLALLGFFGHVVEERRVARELLDAREAVVRRVARRLDHPQRERAVPEHLATPLHGFDLEVSERDDGIHESHRECFLRVVLPAEKPDLARLLLPNRAREQP